MLDEGDFAILRCLEEDSSAPPRPSRRVGIPRAHGGLRGADHDSIREVEGVSRTLTRASFALTKGQGR